MNRWFESQRKICSVSISCRMNPLSTKMCPFYPINEGNSIPLMKANSTSLKAQLQSFMPIQFRPLLFVVFVGYIWLICILFGCNLQTKSPWMIAVITIVSQKVVKMATMLVLSVLVSKPKISLNMKSAFQIALFEIWFKACLKIKVLVPIHSLIPQFFSKMWRFWYQKLSHYLEGFLCEIVCESQCSLGEISENPLGN